MKRKKINLDGDGGKDDGDVTDDDYADRSKDVDHHRHRSDCYNDNDEDKKN